MNAVGIGTLQLLDENETLRFAIYETVIGAKIAFTSVKGVTVGHLAEGNTGLDISDGPFGPP